MSLILWLLVFLLMLDSARQARHVKKLRGRVGALESDISNLRGGVGTLERDVASLRRGTT